MQDSATGSEIRQPLTFRSVVTWIIAGIVGIFASVLIHEAGHSIGGNIAYRDSIATPGIFPEVNLDTTTPLQRAFSVGLGPIMTYLTTIIFYLLQLRKINPFTYMIGFTASIRAFAGVDGIIDHLRGATWQDSTSDEVSVAVSLGISPYITVAISLLVLFIAWYFYLSLIQRRQGSRMIPVVFGSMVAAGFSIFLFAQAFSAIFGRNF